MNTEKIKPVKNGFVNVIIETPKGAQNKFTYDPELRLFRIKKALPLGMVFPFDFGFIPNTKGGDGDPLDVLVIMDQPAYPGTLVECRLIGVLEAKQKDKKSKEVRNDRIIAVPHYSILYGSIQRPEELNKGMTAEIEHFFIDYNLRQGKKFTPIKWAGAKEALNLINKGSIPEEKGTSH